MADKATEIEAANIVAKAIRSIAEGDRHPGGLEGLAMAIAGEGLNSSLGGATEHGLSDVAEAIRELAEQVGKVALAIKGKANG